MKPYLKIPYTEAQAALARTVSLARVDKALPFRNWDNLNAYAKVEQSHFGCNLLQFIPGQLSRSICSTFLSSPHQVTYIFEDSFAPADLDWVQQYIVQFQQDVFWWSRVPRLESTCAKCETFPLGDDSLTRWWRFRDERGHQNVIAVIIIRIGDSLSSALKMLRDPKSRSELSELPSLQLVIDASICGENAISLLSELFSELRSQGFHLLSKSLDVERSGDKSLDDLNDGRACAVTMTFAK
jgi:hypothetical protein